MFIPFVVPVLYVHDGLVDAGESAAQATVSELKRAKKKAKKSLKRIGKRLGF